MKVISLLFLALGVDFLVLLDGLGVVLLVGGPHHDEAAVGPGDGTADEHVVVFLVDLDDFEVAGGDAGVAVLAGAFEAALRPAATAVAGERGATAVLARALLDAVAGAEALE